MPKKKPKTSFLSDQGKKTLSKESKTIRRLLKLDEYDKKIREFSVAIYGTPGMGKSHTVEYLLRKLGK